MIRLAALDPQAKREAQFNRGVVRQHDWLRKYSGGLRSHRRKIRGSHLTALCSSSMKA